MERTWGDGLAIRDKSRKGRRAARGRNTEEQRPGPRLPGEKNVRTTFQGKPARSMIFETRSSEMAATAPSRPALKAATIKFAEWFARVGENFSSSRRWGPRRDCPLELAFARARIYGKPIVKYPVRFGKLRGAVSPSSPATAGPFPYPAGLGEPWRLGSRLDIKRISKAPGCASVCQRTGPAGGLSHRAGSSTASGEVGQGVRPEPPEVTGGDSTRPLNAGRFTRGPVPIVSR